MRFLYTFFRSIIIYPRKKRVIENNPTPNFPGTLNGGMKEMEHGNNGCLDMVVKNNRFNVKNTSHLLKTTIFEIFETIRHPRRAVKTVYKSAIEKGGKTFAIFAIVWWAFEDWVGPAILYSSGHPDLGTILLIGHYEWIAYPAYFSFIKLFKSIKFCGFKYMRN